MFQLSIVSLTIIFVTIRLGNSICPEGAITGMNNQWCYKFYGLPDTFYNAEAKCQNTHVNGHLASSTNVFLNSFIKTTLSDIVSDTSAKTWLGGFQNGSNWAWTDGSPFSYSTFDKGQNVTLNNCLSIIPNTGLWYSNDCNFKLPYFCEIPGIQNTTQITPTPPTCKLPCDSEWTYFAHTNFCYKVFHQRNFTDAEQYCKSFGAHLTSIHDALENQFIFNIATSALTIDAGKWYDQVAIGLNDLEEIGDFHWTDETPFDYTNWEPGHPGCCQDVQKCSFFYADVQVNATDGYQKMATAKCEWIFRAFVCKKRSN